MKIFKEPNLEVGFVCPICRTSEVSPVTLVKVLKEGAEDIVNLETIQVHIGCLDLAITKSNIENTPTVIYHAGVIE